MKKISNKNSEEKNKEKNRKIILIIIAIIIIVLALITSCSCTSKFWGRIGDLFRNEGTYVFKEKEGAFCENGLYCETIINKELKFNKDNLSISVSDENVKLTYTATKIVPSNLVCTTSDASIATCYVNKDGYVVINPKREGKVTITLQTEENDKIYQATTEINIGKPTKGIFLSSSSGTINLKKTSTKIVTYRLVGATGEISVTSSDESIATATIKDGILKITAYKTGKVTFTITVEDNGKTYTTTYTLTVVSSDSSNTGGNTGKPEDPNNPNKPGDKKDSNNKLSNLTTNKGTLSPVFNENTKNYKISVSADDNDLTLKATPSSKKATVTYTFNGKTNTSGKIEGLTAGDNIVTITVKAENGTTNIYTVTINKPGKPDTPKDSDSSLSSLTTNKGDLNETFNSERKDYSKDVNASDTSITIIAKPTSPKATVTYTYKDNDTVITNATGEINNLKPGENKVTVTVTAEDGSKTNYTVTINRPHTYTIEFENDSIECYMESKICRIPYKAFMDGTEQEDVTKDLTLSGFTGEYKITKDYIELTPTNDMIGNTYNLALNYKTGKGTISVSIKTEEYKLEAEANKYPIVKNEKNNVMLLTDLFNNHKLEELDITENGNEIIIKSKKYKDFYLKVYTLDSDKISISYNKDNGLSSLAISVNVLKDIEGSVYIHAEGYAFGKLINSKQDIELNIVKKYLLILNANGGEFNTYDTYKFSLSARDSIDLAEVNNPIKAVEDNDCLKYEFVGFSKDKDFVFTPDNIPEYYFANDAWNKKITITEDTILYAVYDLQNEIDNSYEEEVMWLKDVPLFHNEEYFNKYHKDKIIYPGAYGNYTMKFVNETLDDQALPKDLSITGIILEENTICVDIDNDNNKDGCINMGYIIKHSDNFLYGASKDYIILHTDNLTSPIVKDETYRRVINFNPITVNTDSTLPTEITIHWEWAFDLGSLEDKIDTAIGNQAAASTTNNTLNDMYQLKVGIKYKVKKTTCKTTGD